VSGGFQPAALRADFPLLSARAGMTYLDSAATTPIVRPALAALAAYYEQIGATPYRGGHFLTEEASAAFEAARARVADFIGAARGEVVFVRNATEAMNLVASAYRPLDGGEVLVEAGEHHSNLLAWRRRRLRVLPCDPAAPRDFARLAAAIGPDTRLVAAAHASNVTGIVRDPRPLVEAAHRRGAAVLLDAAQTAPHGLLDVAALGCDFAAFSGHKMLGPRGIGVLYVRSEIAGRLEPYQLGGGVVERVDPAGLPLFKAVPWRFEAGTFDVAGVVGLAAALGYLEALGLPAIRAHAGDLAAALDRALRRIPELELIGPPREAGDLPIVAFTTRPGGLPAAALARILDQRGIVTRFGSLCAGPHLAAHGKESALRVSGYVYSDDAEVAHLAATIRTVLGTREAA